MKSLVTGASGFIGSYLVDSLTTAGDQVRILVRPTSNLHWVSPQAERCVGDLANAASVREAVRGVDRVFHCAAVVSDWGDPAIFHEVNVTGTTLLLEAALGVGVKKFVHVSTTDVYGYPGDTVTEDAPFRYRGWPYGDTKIDAEKVVWEYAGRGLPTTVIRPATVYGPRAPIVTEIVKLLRQKEMVFIGTGNTNAGLCQVDNLIAALLLAGRPEIGVGRAYNIEDGLGVTWKQFTNRLAAMLGLKPVRASIPRRVAYFAGWTLESWGRARKQSSRPLITRMSAELLGTSQNFSNQRARQELRWEPAVGFDEGMNRMQAWLRSLEAVPTKSDS
jgi:nucleoside-diphosphate-sugar epimerase